MPLQEIYYIAEMVVGVAVIISIVFVAIELRQNTRIMKRDMAADRKQRMNWLLETGCTDSDFRAFHRKVDTEFDSLDDDEKWRAGLFGARVVKSLLDELLDYLDGNISSDEWLNLQWNIEYAKQRPYSDVAYQILKTGYPDRVQQFWESWDLEGCPKLAA